MNITFDYQVFIQQSYGGISRYFSEISKRISCLNNNNVCILSPLYINNYISRNKNEINVKGIKIPYIKNYIGFAGEINMTYKLLLSFLFGIVVFAIDTQANI